MIDRHAGHVGSPGNRFDGEARKAGAFHEQFASRLQNAGSSLFAGRLTLTKLIGTRTHRDLTSSIFYCIVCIPKYLLD